MILSFVCRICTIFDMQVVLEKVPEIVNGIDYVLFLFHPQWNK